MLQIPPAQIPSAQIPNSAPPVVQRRIRPGDRSSYSVVSDWDSPNGRAHYEYRMSMQVERTKEPKSDYTVVVRLSRLTAVYDGTVTHTENLGVIPMNLGPGGPPRGIAAGGALTTYALPLIAFTVPNASPGLDGGFTVSPFRVESVGSFSGSGQVEGSPTKDETITLLLMLGTSASPPTLDIRSGFGPGGSLRHSEGTYVDANGKLSFKIDRA